MALMSDEEWPPFPPDEYISLISGPLPADLNIHEWFDGIGQMLVAILDAQKMLGASIRLLDIGCGCGRVARSLLRRPLVASYVGFDRHRGMIDWCRQEIGSRCPSFTFKYFDIRSSYQALDGVEGTIAAVEFKFPFDDNAFDSVLLASVFTHMPLVEIEHYLHEIYRVLGPGGRVLLSVFFNEGEIEVARDEINFFLSREQFLGAVRAAHFHPKLIASEQHNWFILEPLPIAFDPGTYLAIHKDVAAAGMDPAEHYVSYGRAEGRRLR